MRRIPGRELTKVAVGAALVWLLVVMLTPVASATGDTLVGLIDGQGDRAIVDGGRLRVGDGNGALTVDGVVSPRHSMRGRSIYHSQCLQVAYPPACSFTPVPDDRVLIVTHVSARVATGVDDVISTVTLRDAPFADSTGRKVHLAWTARATIEGASVSHYHSLQVEVPIRPGRTPWFYVNVADGDGTGGIDDVTVDASLTGYLVPLD